MFYHWYDAASYCYTYTIIGSHIDSIPLGPFLLECRIPQNITQTIAHINLTEDNRALLEMEGHCFLACSSHTDIFSNTEVKNNNNTKLNTFFLYKYIYIIFYKNIHNNNNNNIIIIIIIITRHS